MTSENVDWKLRVGLEFENIERSLESFATGYLGEGVRRSSLRFLVAILSWLLQRASLGCHQHICSYGE
ncbi:hypothetical protein AAZX31_16G081200 [Glycine max]|uniref:Uncharacterized protein n=1 Tax=Glycine max TaxID=3847 RepID=A0A0R0FVQ7_SOYBN|nr:hypothetical protein GLYMA_16G088100v4 [Glycine max]